MVIFVIISGNIFYISFQKIVDSFTRLNRIDSDAGEILFEITILDFLLNAAADVTALVVQKVDADTLIKLLAPAGDVDCTG